MMDIAALFNEQGFWIGDVSIRLGRFWPHDLRFPRPLDVARLCQVEPPDVAGPAPGVSLDVYLHRGITNGDHRNGHGIVGIYVHEACPAIKLRDVLKDLVDNRLYQRGWRNLFGENL